MKYCIACKHLYYTPSDPGYDTEYTFGIGAEDASLSCKKNHWHRYICGGEIGFDLQKAMESADSCKDFTERTAG